MITSDLDKDPLPISVVSHPRTAGQFGQANLNAINFRHSQLVFYSP